MKRLLVVDDETGTRESLRAIFQDEYEVITAENAVQARAFIGQSRFDLLILDVIMPGINGIAFLQEVRLFFPEIPVIMISGSYNDQTVQQAKNLHAVAFVCKPFDIHELRHLISQTLKASDATRQQFILKREVIKKFAHNVLGDSDAINKAIEEVKKASQSDSPVLIVGEVGSGRELFARQIHSWSRRGSEPFIKIESPRFDQQSIDTEIFGLGASDEVSTSPGAFDHVAGGVLYIDNAETLQASTRARIRHAIEHKKFQRVGYESAPIPHAARVLASCSISPSSPLSLNSLLGELADSFTAHIIQVPPLRERTEDIPVLATHYLHQFRAGLNARTTSIEPEAIQKLQAYAWPGNILELRIVIERVLLLHGDEEVLKAAFLPREIGGDLLPPLDPASISYQEATDQLHRQMITSALEKANGIVKNAAALLNITPRILQHRIDKLKIESNKN